MTIWRAGMKAVCIDESWVVPRKQNWLGRWFGVREPAPLPRKDGLYIVTRVSIGWDGEQWLGLRGFGIENDPRDVVYIARAFRPVQERKTDISVFTAMLTPQKAKEDA